MRSWIQSLSLAAGLLCSAGPAVAEEIERVIAKVNGDIITLSDLLARQVDAVQRARVPLEKVETFLRAENPRILQEAIDDVLILQHGADIGQPVTPESVKAAIEDLKKRNDIKSDADLSEQLHREGMSLDDLKRNIARGFLRSQVMQREVDAKAQVTETDARMDYETRKSRDYSQPATLRLAEIVVQTGSGEPLAQAREIVQRARAGEDFATLARQYSSAPSRQHGGDLGLLVRQEINPELAKVVDGLSVGQISEPMPVKGGYRVIKLVEFNEGKVTPFEEVKDAILEQLRESRREQEYQRLVQQLRKDAIVDRKVREIPLPLGSASAPLPSALADPSALSALPSEPPGPDAALAARPAPRADEPEIAVSPMEKPRHEAPPAPEGQKPPAPPAEKPKS